MECGAGAGGGVFCDQEREMKDIKPEYKLCRTVGQLISELQKLPKSARLEEPMRPVHYNLGEQERLLGLKRKVGFWD